MRILVGLLASALLVACGEGDSSTGGGGETTASVTSNAAPAPAGAQQSSAPANNENSAGSLEGVYTGTAKVTVTIDTLNLEYELDTRIEIQANGAVLVDIEGETDLTQLNGNDYEGDVEFEESKDGIICSGRIFYSGTVGGSNTSGTTRGDGVCNQDGQLADVTMNGSYVASRQ